MTIIHILISLFFLSFIIFVHELFHLLAAKMLKVDATEFAVGFGPSFFVFQKDGDKKYVKFFPKKDDPNIKRELMKYYIRIIPLGGYVSFAEEHDGVLSDGLIKHKPWKRIIVALAGPVGNFVFAIVLAYCYLIYSTHDVYTGDGYKVTLIQEKSIAEKMGVKQNDIILKMNNKKITSPEIIGSEIKKGKSLCIDLKRNSSYIKLCGDLEGQAILGIQFNVNKTEYNFVSAVPESVRLIYNLSIEYSKQFIHMIQNFKIKELSGPVGTVDAMQKTVPDTEQFMVVLIMVNIGLGAANLLFPFSITDGGRIVIDLLAILFKRHSLPTKYLDTLSVCLMLLLMATTVVLDIQRIIN